VAAAARFDCAVIGVEFGSPDEPSRTVSFEPLGRGANSCVDALPPIQAKFCSLIVAQSKGNEKTIPIDLRAVIVDRRGK
jgi:hypothetical protein